MLCQLWNGIAFWSRTLRPPTALKYFTWIITSGYLLLAKGMLMHQWNCYFVSKRSNPILSKPIKCWISFISLNWSEAIHFLISFYDSYIRKGKSHKAHICSDDFFNTHALGNLSLVLIVSNLVLYKMNNLLKVFLFNPKNKFQSSTLCPYFLHRSVFTLQRHV